LVSSNLFAWVGFSKFEGTVELLDELEKTKFERIVPNPVLLTQPELGIHD
jgi:hypothetical protein